MICCKNCFLFLIYCTGAAGDLLQKNLPLWKTHRGFPRGIFAAAAARRETGNPSPEVTR
jgi:hypothetical protein